MFATDVTAAVLQRIADDVANIAASATGRHQLPPGVTGKPLTAARASALDSAALAVALDA